MEHCADGAHSPTRTFVVCQVRVRQAHLKVKHKTRNAPPTSHSFQQSTICLCKEIKSTCFTPLFSPTGQCDNHPHRTKAMQQRLEGGGSGGNLCCHSFHICVLSLQGALQELAIIIIRSRGPLYPRCYQIYCVKVQVGVITNSHRNICGFSVSDGLNHRHLDCFSFLLTYRNGVSYIVKYDMPKEFGFHCAQGPRHLPYIWALGPRKTVRPTAPAWSTLGSLSIKQLLVSPGTGCCTNNIHFIIAFLIVFFVWIH